MANLVADSDTQNPPYMFGFKKRPPEAISKLEYWNLLLHSISEIRVPKFTTTIGSLGRTCANLEFEKNFFSHRFIESISSLQLYKRTCIFFCTGYAQNTRVRVLILMAGGSYQIFSCKYVPQIILIDRYSGIGTQKYLRYSKVPVLYRDCIGPTSRR